jgi:two-component system, response regulator
VESKVVLLVEDNPDDEALTLRELRKNNIANEIIVARDGVEALAYLFDHRDFLSPRGRDLPQLVLLDLNMPKIDGLEVLRRIRADERTRLLPVVVLTASQEDSDRIKAHGLGINGYVRKPVKFLEFGEAVRTLGLSWLLLAQSPLQGRHSPQFAS